MTPLPVAVPEVVIVAPTPVIAGPQRTQVAVDPGSHVTGMSGPIELIAVTEDGSAAVTADDKRSVRVWPTLDGKHEPVVVKMQPPAMLAIARNGDALVLAGIDPVGQLEIVTTTAAGDATRRIDVAIERPIVAMHATNVGFVAVRDDRVVSVIDAAGELRAELATEPGDYLASIAVRRGRALAMIETAGRVRGRWIDLATASWGAWTPVLPILADHVALSPDHRRIAALRPGGEVLAFVTLADGKVVERVTHVTDHSRPVGFVDHGAVVMLGDNGAWWTDAASRNEIGGEMVAIADRIVVQAQESTLAVAENTVTHYIGYRMSAPTELLPTRSGYMVAEGQLVAELDTRFRTRAGYEILTLTPQGEPGVFTRVELVAGDFGIASTYANTNLYLVNLKLAERTFIAVTTEHDYQPSTRLLYYYSPTEGARATRFDLAAGAFGPAVAIPSTKSGEVILVDPDAAGGAEVAIVEDIVISSDYRVTFGKVSRDAFVPMKERVIRATDWDSEVGVLARSTNVRAHSPDRSMVAELRDQRLVLRAGKTVRWTVPSAGAESLAWTPRGELIIYGEGIARVDLATGALRERQCGLWFGRWDQPPLTIGVSRLCEAP